MSRTLFALAMLALPLAAQDKPFGSVLPALAQDKQDARKWAEALAYYQRFSASRDPVERKQSADALGDATYEKVDKLCWQLVSALLRAELAKEGQSGRTEEKISGEVLAIDGSIGSSKATNQSLGMPGYCATRRASTPATKRRSPASSGSGPGRDGLQRGSASQSVSPYLVERLTVRMPVRAAAGRLAGSVALSLTTSRSPGFR